MMKKYRIFLTLIIFLSTSCGEKLSTTTKDESANVSTEILAGTWTSECIDNTTATTSRRTVLVFSETADNLSSTSTNYSDLNCITRNFVISTKLNTLSLGRKSTTDQNQIITKFTAVVSDITLEPITSNAATSLNIDTYCGLASWSSATPTSIAGLTCDSITYKTQNADYHNLIQINSNKTFIRLGNIRNLASSGYPKTIYTEEYYK